MCVVYIITCIFQFYINLKKCTQQDSSEIVMIDIADDVRCDDLLQ